ncbi:MAG: hypothetical protein OER87_13560 [Gammaproteobacteria bacterium]|nr:hypothetical protein [Gammaproteobacteria bacterium]
MVRNKILLVRLGVAGLAFCAAFSVYLFARIYPPEILTPFSATGNIHASYTGIFGIAPSFFYTLSIGLLVGACASTLSTARLHCLSWISLALLLELSQYPALAEPLSTWLAAVLPASGWEIVRPYWIRGVFDPLDMLATLMGGMIALVLLTHLPKEKNNVPDS